MTRRNHSLITLQYRSILRLYDLIIMKSTNYVIMTKSEYLNISQKNKNCIVTFANFVTSVGLIGKLLKDGIFDLSIVPTAVKWMDRKNVHVVTHTETVLRRKKTVRVHTIRIQSCNGWRRKIWRVIRGMPIVEDQRNSGIVFYFT